MKFCTTIQARAGSKRFPNKILHPLYGNLSVIDVMHHRIQRPHPSSVGDSQATFLIPTTKENDVLAERVSGLCHVFRGDENSIIRRINAFTKEFLYCVEGICVVELTSDCPLIDWRLVNGLIDEFEEGEYDYLSNCLTRSYPDGFDVQIYKARLLLAAEQFVSPTESQHGGWNIVNNLAALQKIRPVKVGNIPAPQMYRHPEWGLTLDYEEDLELLRTIFSHFGCIDFAWNDAINAVAEHPEWLEINKHRGRNIPGHG